jgi:hypothetical protein
MTNRIADEQKRRHTSDAAMEFMHRRPIALTNPRFELLRCRELD